VRSHAPGDVIRFPLGVTDFQLSPDGSRVAFVEEGQIWQIGLEDNAPQFIAKGSTPRWSPD